MFKRLVVLLLINISCLAYAPTVFADTIPLYKTCPNKGADTCAEKGYSCQPSDADTKTFICKPDTVGTIFGKITPPDSIKKLIGSDQTGAGGISQFLSNLVALFFSIAAIVLIFMLLWGAFEWLSSGGDKEKLQSAQRRIISAIIGIILFATTFAIIAILGQFTGFKFFKG